MGSLVSKPRYCIGIDPGIISGFAIYDRQEKRLISVRSMQLWELFETLRNWKDNSIEVCIENPNTFFGFSKEDKRGKVEQGAGAVKQTYKHIIEYLEHLCIQYTKIKLQGGLKKVNADLFARITGWSLKSNEHGRDAGLMCFNK